MNHPSPEKLLRHFLENPATAFTILVLGERGTGKSSKISSVAQELKKEVIHVNCASFSDDNMAESQLFGHEKGAYTGAEKEHKGLFQEAKGNILFLDEIHSLSKRVQQKLMISLQTPGSGNNKGKFGFRSLGSTEVKFVDFRPVFASNLEVSELKKRLMPDFYDRISQLIVRFPSIREQELSIYDEFYSVWKNMQFKTCNKKPPKKLLGKWLSQIELPGNYRNLQAIAINWHQGRLIFGEEAEYRVFEFVQNQFKLSMDSNTVLNEENPYNFEKGKSKEEYETHFRQALYDWAVSSRGYGNPTAAARGLKFKSIRLLNTKENK